MSASAAIAAAVLASDAGAALQSRYREPWRRYHDWSHVSAMLAHLSQAESDGVAVDDPVAAVGFVLWHDAIYDPQAPHGRNEALSAELCRAEFAAEAGSVDRAVAAILATVDHRVPEGGHGDTALLLDIDLSVLGADATTFARYDAGIAHEYAHVAEAPYRAGRAAVLRRFLERERLFLTEWAATRWEAAARCNLAERVAALEA